MEGAPAVITIQFDDAGLSVNLSKAKQVTPTLLQRWMSDVTKHLHTAVVRNIAKGGLVGRRTGNLARAVKDQVNVIPNGVVGIVWPDPEMVAYGAIQEEGGTVVPKNGQFLAIPLDAMLTGNGVARGTAGQVRDNPGGFGFTGTFVHDGIVFGKQGNRGSIIPLFALKRSVTIPATHYLSTTLVQETTWMAARLEKLTGEMVAVSFSGEDDAA